MDTQDLAPLKKLGLAQKDLAHKAEIDRSYIGVVEHGELNQTDW